MIMPVQPATGDRGRFHRHQSYGKGEWKARQNGVSKRRTLRKLHLGVDEATGEIGVAEVTTNDYHDSEILPSLLNGIDGEIAQVSDDGAYDTFVGYEAIAQRAAVATIPHRHDAQPYRIGETVPTHPRDQILQRIDQVGRSAWKQESGYPRRSLAETTMFRLKVTFAGHIRSRSFDN